MNIRLGEAEQVFIEHGILENLRNDGRGNDEYRPIFVETGIINNAYGSARVRLGNTDVLVGVKAEIDKPLPSTPDKGRLQFFVDCSANATPEFEGRGGTELSDDVAAVLTAAFSNDAALDARRLCIVPGKICWLLYVDVVVLEYGGNAYDASSLAVKAALFNCKIPTVRSISDDRGETDIEISDDPYDCWKLDVRRAPLLISVGKVAQRNVVDLTSEEEVCCKTTLLVGVSGKDDSAFITLAKQTRGGSLDPDSLDDMITSAVRIGSKLEETFMNSLLREEESHCDTVGFLAVT